MQWVIVIVACLVIGGWMFRTFIPEAAAEAREGKNTGQYFAGLIVFAVIAFVILLVIGTLTGRH
jgi:hypothetical protein